MALTVTSVMKTATKDAYLHIWKVDFDSSYPTGGEALTTTDLGFSDVANLLTVVCFPRLGYVCEYDAANSKLKAFWVDTTTDGAPMAEVVNTTNLATLTDVLVFAFGTKPA